MDRRTPAGRKARSKSQIWRNTGTSVGKIKQHVNRAGTITHRLLGFSRKISSEYDVQLNELIQETISFLESEANSNNIIINLQFDEELPMIRTDGAQVQQALLEPDRKLAGCGRIGRTDRHHYLPKHAKEVSMQIATTVPESNPKSWKKFGSRSLPPRRPEKAPAWGSPSAAISPINWAVPSPSKTGRKAALLFTLKLPLRG